MVLDRLDEYSSFYAACESIALKLGVGSESLRRWTLQAQIDSGQRSGATSDEMVEIKALKNKVSDLEEANEILRQASMLNARELDPRQGLICQFIDGMRVQGSGVESICAVAGEQGCHLAPRTYRAWKRKRPCARTISGAHVTNAMLDTVGTPEGLYGRRQMIVHLQRQGIDVSAGTVHRLMGDED